MELSDQILKALMDVDQERGHFFSLKSITDKHRPPLSPAKIAKIITNFPPFFNKLKLAAAPLAAKNMQ